MKYLQLVRYQNLLMLAFMQILFRYAFLEQQDIPLALSNLNYGLLILSTLLIAAAGYVINDIFDVVTDSINKPANVLIGKKISETTAYNLYIILNISGVALGFYLSNVIGKPGFATIFILIASLLYFYSTTLKSIMILGNIAVAFVLSISVLIIGVFDLYPVTFVENRGVMGSFFSILTDYAIFAFMINLLREIVKDIEDVNGDYNQGMNTLPIAIGMERTAKVVLVLTVIPIISLLLYIKNYFFDNNLYLITLYGIAFVLAPLLYFVIKLLNAKTQKDFHHLSSVLKLVLFFGIVSIAIITLNIQFNA
jgi:4-hydroxybenzoate polyprenyltransferase